MIEVGTGYCLAFGGTKAREAVVGGGEVLDYREEATPKDPDDFFKWMAHRVLRASDSFDADWTVVGVPGPAFDIGGEAYIGPLTNVQGLKKEEYNLVQELEKADPATRRLLESGFTLLSVNDGDLAAHAVANRLTWYASRPGINRIGALIVGTGVGFGAVERDLQDPEEPRLFHTIKERFEIGHVPYGNKSPKTIERVISGPAILEKYGISAEDLPLNHKAWRKVGRTMAREAIAMACNHRIDLIIPTGGVGVFAKDKYGDEFTGFIEEYRTAKGDDAAIRRKFAPRVGFVNAKRDGKVIEMFGAESVMRSHMVLEARAAA